MAYLGMICAKVEEFLPVLEENAFDACLCDPPYGLSFMGKGWDHGVPSVEVWREVLRVLKPGAMLLAFGGTRTHHRLMCAIEDAGFELRDCLMWLYGCLSDDTEVLIDGQWEHYSKATAGSLALCYDVSTREFSHQPIQQLVEYPYDDTAYRIQSDSTDQIVSRNHRCIVERGGAEVFEYAEHAARQPEIRVPVVEDLRGLLQAVPLPYARAGEEEQDLLNRLPEGATPLPAKKTQADERPENDADRVRGVWQKEVDTGIAAEASRQADVLPRVQRRVARNGVGGTRAQGSGSVDGGIGAVCCAEDDRPEQSGVEGRRDLLPQARQLPSDQVRALSGGVSRHGAEGRLRDGAPSDCGAVNGQASLENGSGASRQPRPDRQPAGVDAVSEQPGTQAVRASRHTRSDLARITPIHYRGVVWCLRVPTGAFVARRNGKVFVTGNSGFPKSLDISKAIDKAARGVPQGGADPTSPNHGKFKGGCSADNPAGRGFGAGPGQFMKDSRSKYDGANRQPVVSTSAGYGYETKGSLVEPAPLTEEARMWSGYGTALKPAWEPIILAMKPLAGTFAENALVHGVAGLAIDACRIGTTENLNGGAYAVSGNRNPMPGDERTGAALGMLQPGKTAGVEFVQPAGRWPANLLLDEEAAARLDEQSGKVGGGYGTENRAEGQGRYGKFSGSTKGKVVGFGDSGGASRFFYCAKASSRERGEGNNHPTVKPLELCRYLASLVLPPLNENERKLLVPFAGSGSEMIGGQIAGWEYVVGIEQEEKYCAIAESRFIKNV